MHPAKWPAWAIAWDGPAAGRVFEVAGCLPRIRVRLDADGDHVYRLSASCNGVLVYVTE